MTSLLCLSLVFLGTLRSPCSTLLVHSSSYSMTITLQLLHYQTIESVLLSPMHVLSVCSCPAAARSQSYYIQIECRFPKLWCEDEKRTWLLATISKMGRQCGSSIECRGTRSCLTKATRGLLVVGDDLRLSTLFKERAICFLGVTEMPLFLLPFYLFREWISANQDGLMLPCPLPEAKTPLWRQRYQLSW